MTATGRTPRGDPTRLLGRAGAWPTRTTAGGVLVGVDTNRAPGAGAGGLTGALAWAADEALALGRPLYLLTACAPADPLTRAFGHLGSPWDEPDREDAAPVLGHLADVLGGWAVSGLVVTTETVTGHAPDVLLEASPTADLLVVGRRPPSDRRRRAEAGISSSVAGRSPVPVAVVPEDWAAPGAEDGAPVVVGVDLHHDDLQAPARSAPGRHLARLRERRAGALVVVAAAYAARHGARLRVVSCWDPPAGPALPVDRPDGDEERRAAEVEDWVEALPQLPTGLDVRVETRVGPAADELVACAASSSLVVVGRHPGRLHTSSFCLGSTTRSLLWHAPGPVLVVPQS